MDNNIFIPLCKAIIAKEYQDVGVTLDENNIYVVWLNKTLSNNKALLSTTVEDGMYYEITYNGDKKELYFDSYRKVQNMCIPFVDKLLNGLKEEK